MDMNVGCLISHQISMIAQHDSSRLGFPSLIIALCRARGVTYDSRMLESLRPTINLAYVKKNCWNLDDLTVTFRGPRKAKGKRSETLPSSEIPSSATPSIIAPASSTPSPSAPASSLPTPASAPTPLPVLAAVSTGLSSFTSKTLFAMLQSLHKGYIIIVQCLQSSVLQPMMSMEEFLSKMAWPGVQPSPSGGGEASTAQEPVPEEDEPIPPEPFVYETDPVSAQEEVASPAPVPVSPAPITDDYHPSAPALEQEQPIP
ncbi:predicted GPI-anchored protein 58 [Glycine soja]|uniref:predicted GPI-anchored protein 58 n=1 Tax=Glycine soja TaxID=3848 RepID=UPI00103BB3FC|nr:predicted GPI-anchored protein 58 [Glycine soja]